jgi:hypothetical protein
MKAVVRRLRIDRFFVVFSTGSRGVELGNFRFAGCRLGNLGEALRKSVGDMGQWSARSPDPLSSRSREPETSLVTFHCFLSGTVTARENKHSDFGC